MRRPALPSGRWSRLTPVAIFVAAVAITALVALALIRPDGDSDGDEVAGLADGPSTAARVTVREAPADGAPATVTPAAGSPPEATPTLTPDFPDLVVDDVYSRDNRLVVVVANDGSADADGPIEVSVDGGPAQRIDVGKPLRPGDRLERTLEHEYIQRRAQVVVTVTGSAALREENAGNNVFAGVVAPDAPNDLEIAAVEYAGDDGHLVVTLRNHSPIPLRGTVTIGVRQTAPTNQPLVREERPLDIAAGGMQPFDFPDFSGVPLDFLRVILFTDAINDADISNNSFPR